MVKRDVVQQKLARAVAWLDDAETRFGQPRDAFLADASSRDLAMFHLFLALQECIDLATHWIVDDGLPPADDYGSAFSTLAAHGRIDAELASGMRQAAGLRNLIAHGYASIDPARVYDEGREGIPGIRRFLDAVARRAGL
jgi:uncharacterized protein YutE (UPF0331/DUF86 family)